MKTKNNKDKSNEKQNYLKKKKSWKIKQKQRNQWWQKQNYIAAYFRTVRRDGAKKLPIKKWLNKNKKRNKWWENKKNKTKKQRKKWWQNKKKWWNNKKQKKIMNETKEETSDEKKKGRKKW